MEYLATFIKEDLGNDTIDVAIPALGVAVRGLKATRPKGLSYAYNEFSTFGINLDEGTVDKIKKSNSKNITANTFNLTAHEHRQPTQQVDNKILKPILQASSGIGETFIAEMTKCAENIIGYFQAIIKDGENLAAKMPGAKNRKKTESVSEKLGKKLQNAVRLTAAGVSQATFGSKDPIQAPALTVDQSDNATLHGSTGTGFHTDKRGQAVQGQMSFSESTNKAPMGVIGVDSIDFVGKDILPKGNVLTPHVNKIPDIMGLIALGIGTMNVINVIRTLCDIEAGWIDKMNEGIVKAQNDSFDLIKEMNNRVNGILGDQLAARKRTTKSQTERILELTAKIREDIEREREKQAEKERQQQAAAQVLLQQQLAAQQKLQQDLIANAQATIASNR